jgi:transcriptional regulator with XRE-family HTH domain
MAPSTYPNEVAEWLDTEMQARGLTTRELARRANLHFTTISQVITGRQLAGWDFLTAVARPLGSTPIEAFVKAGKLTRAEALAALPRLLTVEQTDMARQIAAAAQALSMEEQQLLLQMLQALAQKKQE